MRLSKPGEMIKVAKQISDIEELGLHLDFTEEEVEAYQAENEKDRKKAWKGTYRMIKDWFNKDESSREKFIEALKDSDMTELADRFRVGGILKMNQETQRPARDSNLYDQSLPVQPAQPAQPAQPSNVGGIDDDTLNNIGNRIFTNIDEFASALGVKYEDLKRYKKTNYRTDEITADGTIQMLFDWREKVPSTEQRFKLGQALEKANLIRMKAEFHL